jgi:probable HAF family extracellular repeat protein
VGLSANASGFDRGFVWRDGTTTELGTLGGFISDATDINNRGQIVGFSSFADYQHPFHAVLWHKDEMTDLGTLGGPSSEALGINDAGHIVGASDTSTGELRAVLWKK